MIRERDALRDKVSNLDAKVVNLEGENSELRKRVRPAANLALTVYGHGPVAVSPDKVGLYVPLYGRRRAESSSCCQCVIVSGIVPDDDFS